MMPPLGGTKPNRPFDLRRLLPAAMAAALLLLLSPFAAGAEESLSASLLTRDLGDPRAPGNVKLVVTMPPSLAGRAATVRSEDFVVHVYPADLPQSDVTDEEHRAGGVYLWRSGNKIFLDVRLLPIRDEEGPALVRVTYAPEGETLAAGLAEGIARYASELVDVVLAVDVSLSMNYTDPSKRRVVAARTFIEMARQGGGIGRVGLVTFNHNAFRNVPLIPLDRGEELLSVLDRVGAEGLTSLDAPLRLGLDILNESGSKRPVIILLTDGKNEGSTYRDSHLLAAQEGVRLFTVGLSESADHRLLEEMADKTNGIYFRAPRDEDLPEIYARLAAELGKRHLLQADLLRSDAGDVSVPIDRTVRRLVALADAGALVSASAPGEGGSVSGDGLGSVFVREPAPGPWRFVWSQAAPNLSALALFGDTQLFLDVFPPQLRGDKLAVGATLAQGIRPLSGARVWAEPILEGERRRVELFDDGRHGDGDAGDGVYGAVVDIPGSPDRFDLTLRASGQAWDKGEFVRQTIGLAIRVPEPPPVGSASLDGDVDFGILFPGESGTALARVDLDTDSPQVLFFDLAWDAGEEPWPDLSSRALVSPGRRSFELEMRVPETAAPGDYLGEFAISDGGDIGDRSIARLRVGTVAFAGPDAVDLGDVPPGTFASRQISVAYDADKPADFAMETSGASALSVLPGPSRLDAGKGDIPLEVMVSVPMGEAEGEYSGLLRIAAGPGRAEVPVRWRVRPYALAEAGPLEEPEGLPPPVEFPGGREGELFPDKPDAELSWHPESPDLLAEMGRPDFVDADGTAGGFRDRNVRPPGILPDPVDSTLAPAVPRAGVKFPETGRIGEGEEDGDSFWSAWWVYLLAALLLLLLLLLLIAYILYRLGKSALARFLLASALANLILLAIFIALLSTAGMAEKRVPTVTVTLVDDDYMPEPEMSDSEKAMLDAASRQTDSSGGGSEARVGEISFAGESISGGESQAARSAETVHVAEEGLELAEAARPSAMPLSTERDRSLARRSRLPERSFQAEPSPEAPVVLDEPAASGIQGAERGAPVDEAKPDIGESRLEIEYPQASSTAVWSDGERVAQPLTSAHGEMLADAVGMETISLDESPARIAPRGRRRSQREIPDAYPEPRVEIADPVRDAAETASPDAPDRRQDDPGVEELRTEPPSMGVRRSGGRRTGAVMAPGVTRLLPKEPERMARGASGSDSEPTAAPRGGARNIRGTAREGVAFANPESGIPGGSGGNAGDRTDAREKTGAGREGGSVEEMRFEDAASGGTDGVAGSSGNARDADAGADRGASYSRLGGSPASGGPSGGIDAVGFEGSGGESTLRGPGTERDGRRRGGRLGGGSAEGDSIPGGLARAPGRGRGGDGPDGPGDDGSGRSGQGNAGSGSGPDAGVGETRFDGFGGIAGGGLESRGGTTLPGVGSSRLDGDGTGGSLGRIATESDAFEWRRNERRGRRRAVSVATGMLDADSLLIVVGDFARLHDPASERLFAELSGRMPRGLKVEERQLMPMDANLADCLLALTTPEELASWSNDDFAAVGRYLAGGGHIWMDSPRLDESEPLMRRLAAASGGEFGRLDAGHQLADEWDAEAVIIGGRVAAVSTGKGWRRDWRYGQPAEGEALRFLVRSLNYFLSGNADVGIALDGVKLDEGLYVEPGGPSIPERLAGAVSAPGRVWDDFGPNSAQSWRMPSWSDPGSISAISDGTGGRALKMDMGGAVRGMSAVYRTLSPIQDFSGVGRVTGEAYYDGPGSARISMVFTVPGPEGWLDFETPPIELGAGWNRLDFSLGGNLRRVVGGGGYIHPLEGAERVGRVGFFLYRDGGQAAVALFRDIRLHED